MHRDLEEPGVYYFYDNWRSQEDLDAHFEMPYMKRIAEMAPDLLAEPLKLIRLEKLGLKEVLRFPPGLRNIKGILRRCRQRGVSSIGTGNWNKPRRGQD